MFKRGRKQRAEDPEEGSTAAVSDNERQAVLQRLGAVADGPPSDDSGEHGPTELRVLQLERENLDLTVRVDSLRYKLDLLESQREARSPDGARARAGGEDENLHGLASRAAELAAERDQAEHEAHELRTALVDREAEVQSLLQRALVAEARITKLDALLDDAQDEIAVLRSRP